MDVADQYFQQLCAWIKETVCEDKALPGLLQRQQAYILKHLTSENASIVQRIRQIHFSPWTIEGGDSASLVAKFWALYHACEDNAIAEFNSTANVKAFEVPLARLMEYKSLLEETKWESIIVVLSAVRSLLESQIKIIIQKHQQFSWRNWYRKQNKQSWTRKDDEAPSWTLFSPIDWANIYSSILLVANDRYVCTRMGKEKIMLENLFQKSLECFFSITQHFNSLDKTDEQEKKLPRITSFRKTLGLGSNKNPRDESAEPATVPFHSADGCPCLERCLDGYYSLRTGEFVPRYPTTYTCVISIQPPSHLKDPTHFGHVASVYRNLLASVAAPSRRCIPERSYID